MYRLFSVTHVSGPYPVSELGPARKLADKQALTHLRAAGEFAAKVTTKLGTRPQLQPEHSLRRSWRRPLPRGAWRCLCDFQFNGMTQAPWRHRRGAQHCESLVQGRQVPLTQA